MSLKFFKIFGYINLNSMFVEATVDHKSWTII